MVIIAKSVAMEIIVPVNQNTQDVVPNASVMKVLPQVQCLIRLNFPF
jgi:hypothetical protein